ncbi:MAG: hypothetical protein H7319_04165 [Spirosoma sp.]|nr:hypothetical protein [Spirosoma sp.]
MNVTFAKPATKERRRFAFFYDEYAPKLWGLILQADLPASVSERILLNTFGKAWPHPHRQAVEGHQMITWLLGLAYAEGLPAVTLPPELKQA